jgi:hypothetical protein
VKNHYLRVCTHVVRLDHCVQKSIVEFARYEDAQKQDGSSASRDAPALLTTLRWSSGTDPDAVLLTPAEVRQTWQHFQQVVAMSFLSNRFVLLAKTSAAVTPVPSDSEFDLEAVEWNCTQ